METRKPLPKNVWRKSAMTEKESKNVNINDIYQRECEFAVINKYLNKSLSVLEIGCGNGFSSKVFSKKVKHIDAFDFVPEMIARAKKENPCKNVNYYVDNILDPKKTKKKYDVVICVRVLCNLRNEKEQARAIKNIAKFVKPTGAIIVSEGVAEPYDCLNEIREEMKLSPLVPSKFNFYSKREFLWQEFEKNKLLTPEYFGFGIYDYLTRVIYPVFVGEKYVKHNTRFHKIAKNAQLADDNKTKIHLSRNFGWVLIPRI